MSDIFSVDWMFEIDEIRRPEILLGFSHEMQSYSCPKEVKIIICKSGDFTFLKEPPLPDHIKRFYMTNCTLFSGKKFVGIPYGTLPFQCDILNKIDLPDKKDKLVYCNFGTGSHPKRNMWWKQMQNKDFVFCEKPPAGSATNVKVASHYFRQLASSKFVICPPGNGPDTYRMWETLMVGSIPIVITSTLIDHFVSDLPILEVGTYSELTAEFLEKQYEIMTSIEYPKNYLRKQYWIDRWLNDIRN